MRHYGLQQMDRVGETGAVRARLTLRRTFLFTESYVVLNSEVHVFRAAERFDAQGVLIDATTQELSGARPAASSVRACAMMNQDGALY